MIAPHLHDLIDVAEPVPELSEDAIGLLARIMVGIAVRELAEAAKDQTEETDG